jgi:SNF2 family DNA or RNA helicase
MNSSHFNPSLSLPASTSLPQSSQAVAMEEDSIVEQRVQLASGLTKVETVLLLQSDQVLLEEVLGQIKTALASRQDSDSLTDIIETAWTVFFTYFAKQISAYAKIDAVNRKKKFQQFETVLVNDLLGKLPTYLNKNSVEKNKIYKIVFMEYLKPLFSNELYSKLTSSFQTVRSGHLPLKPRALIKQIKQDVPEIIQTLSGLYKCQPHLIDCVLKEEAAGDIESCFINCFSKLLEAVEPTQESASPLPPQFFKEFRQKLLDITFLSPLFQTDERRIRAFQISLLDGDFAITFDKEQRRKIYELVWETAQQIPLCDQANWKSLFKEIHLFLSTYQLIPRQCADDLFGDSFFKFIFCKIYSQSDKEQSYLKIAAKFADFDSSSLKPLVCYVRLIQERSGRLNYYYADSFLMGKALEQQWLAKKDVVPPSWQTKSHSVSYKLCFHMTSHNEAKKNHKESVFIQPCLMTFDELGRLINFISLNDLSPKSNRVDSERGNKIFVQRKQIEAYLKQLETIVPSLLENWQKGSNGFNLNSDEVSSFIEKIKSLNHPSICFWAYLPPSQFFAKQKMCTLMPDQESSNDVLGAMIASAQPEKHLLSDLTGASTLPDFWDQLFSGSEQVMEKMFESGEEKRVRIDALNAVKARQESFAFDQLYPSRIPFVAIEPSFIEKLQNWKGLFFYQRTLVQDLWNAHQANQGLAVLDDMGLGKTRQVATFIELLIKNNQVSGPVLVVCPKAVLKTWQKELTVGKIIPSDFDGIHVPQYPTPQALYVCLQQMGYISHDGFVNQEQLNDDSCQVLPKTCPANALAIRRVLRHNYSTKINNVTLWHQLTPQQQEKKYLGKEEASQEQVVVTTFATLRVALNPSSLPTDLQRRAGVVSHHAFTKILVENFYRLHSLNEGTLEEWAQLKSKQLWQALLQLQIIQPNGVIQEDLRAAFRDRFVNDPRCQIAVQAIFAHLQPEVTHSVLNKIVDILFKHIATFGGVVLDEAQAVSQNASEVTKVTIALGQRLEKAKSFRVSLTGTPMQNYFQDLWALHKFLNPHALPEEKIFVTHVKNLSGQAASGIDDLINHLKAEYDLDDTSEELEAKWRKESEELESEALDNLIQLHSEFNLLSQRLGLRSVRRKKTDPEIKLEMQHSQTGVRIPTQDTTRIKWKLKQQQQHALMKIGQVSKAALVINAAAAASSHEISPVFTAPSVTFKTIGAWEKIMNHPILYELEIPNEGGRTNQLEAYFTDILSKKYEGNLDACIQESGRLSALVDQLDARLNQGASSAASAAASSSAANKALIICTSIPTTFLIKIILQQRYGEKAHVHVYHGEQSTEEREKVTHTFNGQSAVSQIVILSLKAGGAGINLYAQDVFQYNLHWNPASNEQAICRAVRTGNPFKHVNVHHFSCLDARTLDDNIEKNTKIKQAWCRFIVDRQPQTLKTEWIIEFYRNNLLESSLDEDFQYNVNAACDSLQKRLAERHLNEASMSALPFLPPSLQIGAAARGSAATPQSVQMTPFASPAARSSYVWPVSAASYAAAADRVPKRVRETPKEENPEETKAKRQREEQKSPAAKASSAASPMTPTSVIKSPGTFKVKKGSVKDRILSKMKQRK